MADNIVALGCIKCMDGWMHPNLRNLHNNAWLRFMVQCNY